MLQWRLKWLQHVPLYGITLECGAVPVSQMVDKSEPPPALRGGGERHIARARADPRSGGSVEMAAQTLFGLDAYVCVTRAT